MSSPSRTSQFVISRASLAAVRRTSCGGSSKTSVGCVCVCVFAVTHCCWTCTFKQLWQADAIAPLHANAAAVLAVSPRLVGYWSLRFSAPPSMTIDLVTKLKR